MWLFKSSFCVTVKDAEFPPKPLINLPLKFGRLNVVEPSPLPYVVPRAANKGAYSVLEIADQSQINHTEGIFEVGHACMVPAGVNPRLPNPDPLIGTTGIAGTK